MPVPRIRLQDGDVGISRLGFGCASLMASLDRAHSLRLIEIAFDCGITHFDVARSYGYGEAERVLGDFLAKYRHRVTVTTKFGILPPSRRVVAPVRRLARIIARTVPALRPLLRHGAESLQRAGVFDPSSLQESLATSLRLLRSDHVDFLLLHECTRDAYGNEELQRFLERCVQEGKARYVGIATSVQTTREILESNNHFPKVIQFQSSFCDRNIKRLAAPQGSIVFTHSPLGACYHHLREHLQNDSSVRYKVSDALRVDLSQSVALSRFLLQHALFSNPKGAVIFSSRSEARVRENATVPDHPWPTAAQFAAVDALLSAG